MAIDPSKFTRKTQEALQAAQAFARDAGNTEIAPDHVLRALLDQSEGIVSGVIGRIGIDLGEVRRRVVRCEPRTCRSASSTPSWSTPTDRNRSPTPPGTSVIASRMCSVER
jgi:ATP-dependent Clp protease ATP-binding subunit ClpB